MFAGSVLTFSDPDRYQAAISPAQVELLVTTKGECRAALTGIKLRRLWLQRGRESLPRVANATVKADRLALFFLASADQAATHHSGRVLAFGEIVASAAGSAQHLRTEGPCHWATLSMTRDDLTAAGHALVGRDLIEPSVTQYLRPSLPLVSRLLNLHQAAGQLARSAADILAQPEVTRALEHALVHAMIMCLTENTGVERSIATQRHSVIMARFEEFLATHDPVPLYVAEICTAIGVSERTLRACCQEQLGMGPIRYLWLRRMHLTRYALVQAAPGTSTVTRIAADHGFFELGQFSIEYRTLFGETPSATLRRPPQEMRTSPFAFANSKYA